MPITTYNASIAYQALDEIQTFQCEALKRQLRYIIDHNAYYQQLIATSNLKIEMIQSLTDLQNFPILTKALVQENIADFICIDNTEIAEIDTTSGTLGSPLSIALSTNDLDRLAYNEMLSFQSMELTNKDVVQLTLTLDRQFMAGMAYYTGLRKIGATIVRIGPGVPQMQWDSIFRYQTTVLVGVPSFILKLLHFAIAHGIDYKHSNVKKILAIGESIYDTKGNPTILYQKLHDLWPIEYFNTYASTEMQTGFTECTAHNGMHLNPDLIIAEVLDEDNKPVVEGEEGELCITTLGVEGVPLIRYKTGDITSISYAPCNCGKQSPRIQGIIGRKQQLLKLKGTSVYPNAVFEALNELNYVNTYILKAFTNDYGLDDAIVFVCVRQSDYNQNVNIQISQHLQAKLKISINVTVLDEKEIMALQFPTHSRKQIKFIDERPSSF